GEKAKGVAAHSPVSYTPFNRDNEEPAALAEAKRALRAGDDLESAEVNLLRPFLKSSEFSKREKARLHASIKQLDSSSSASSSAAAAAIAPTVPARPSPAKNPAREKSESTDRATNNKSYNIPKEWLPRQQGKKPSD